MSGPGPNARCPCGSGAKYKRCCGPLHRGAAAPSPERLMRSRYCAYAIGDVAYIGATQRAPSDPVGVAAFCAGTEFGGLEILETGPDHVTFRATLRQGGRDASFTERSVFARDGGRWVYVSGS